MNSIFFVSRPCRELMNELQRDDWELAFHIENALLDLRPELLRSLVLGTDPLYYVGSVAALKPQGTLSLVPVREQFEMLCGNFLVQDYSLIDLRKLADMCVHYQAPVIEAVTARCRAQGVYSIAYVAAALVSEGGAEIVELRREIRLNQLEHSDVPMPLPPRREPTALLKIDTQGAAARAQIDRQLGNLDVSDNE